MPRNNDEDLPYRSAIPPAPNNSQVTSGDENDYNTLKNVQKLLDDSVNELFKDFNVFELYADKPLAERGKLILHDISVRQGIWDVVAPLLGSVNDAIKIIDNRNKE